MKFMRISAPKMDGIGAAPIRFGQSIPIDRRRGSDVAASSPRFGARAAMLVLLFVACFGCSSTPKTTTLPHWITMESAAEAVGKIVDRSYAKEGDDRRVVIVMDRHPMRSGTERMRPQLRDVQRSNRMFVEYLVQNGYGLLGCEFEKGPVAETPRTKQQYALIRSRLDPLERLDEYPVYQPIRYQILWPTKLEVFGVEDPALYQEDVTRLRRLLEVHRRAKTYPADDEQRRILESERDKLAVELEENIVPRGVAAAQNLLELMESRQMKRAILLVGGAHATSAVEVMKSRGMPYSVFRATSYDAAGASLDEESALDF